MRRMFLAAKCEARLHGKMKTTKKLTSTENHILQKKKKNQQQFHEACGKSSYFSSETVYHSKLRVLEIELNSDQRSLKIATYVCVLLLNGNSSKIVTFCGSPFF